MGGDPKDKGVLAAGAARRADDTQIPTAIARRSPYLSGTEEREPTIEIELEIDGVEGPAGPDGDSAVGGFGRYELLGRLAVGGMAEIYLGREMVDDHVERFVVVKVLKPEIAENEDFVLLFRDEARLAAQLRHPHIAHIYEYGQVAGRHYIAMEWVNGVPLSSHLKRLRKEGQQLPMAVALRIVSDVAEALDYAHSARGDGGNALGVVHRDVSPQNIMISFEGVVKLVDFGVAKAESRLSTTQAGVVRGKFAYMSPEQCVCTANIDGRSDIFSLGTVLHELLTGEYLFERETDFETMRAVAEERIPRPEERVDSIPPELSNIVMRALARSAGNRYSRARDFQEALQRLWVTQGEVVSSGRIADHIQLVWAVEMQGGVTLSRTAFLDSLPPPRRSMTPTPVIRDPSRKVATPVREEPSVPKARRFGFGISELVSVLILGALVTWLAWPEGAPRQPKMIQHGTIDVQTDPPGATVTLGELVLGVTPLQLGRLPMGEQTLEFHLEGYERQQAEVDVGAADVTVSRTLRPTP